MVTLPAGSFTMGSAKGDPGEQPARQVTIDYGLAVGRFEVTVAEWQACARTAPAAAGRTRSRSRRRRRCATSAGAMPSSSSAGCDS